MTGGGETSEHPLGFFNRQNEHRKSILLDDEIEEPCERVEAWNLPGFLCGAKVTTSFGDLPIEALRVNDPVKTVSGEFRKVVWVDCLHIDREFSKAFPDARPIQLMQNALTQSLPLTDLMVSPAQSFLLTKAGGTHAIFARDLLGQPKVVRSTASNFTYFMFHCGQPETVLVDGIWSLSAP